MATAACCCPERYCSLFGGWNDLDEYRGQRPVPPAQLDGSFKDGWLFGLAAGRYLQGGFRGELEFAFRSNNADQWSVAGVPGDWSGHLFTYSGMANLVRDFSTCTLAGFRPYVGAGIGLALIDGDFQTPAISVGVDDAAFAWQAIVGGSRTVRHGLDLFVEYRFFEADFDIRNVTVVPETELGEHDGRHQSVLIGLRFAR